MFWQKSATLLLCNACRVPVNQAHSKFHLSPAKNESKFDIVKLIAKLDARNELVALDKKDVETHLSAGSSKGGQKANRSKSLVTLVHTPTKVTAKSHDCRNLLDNQRLAMARLRKAVDIHVRGKESIFGKMEEENRLRNVEIKKEKIRIAQEKKEKVERLKQLLSEEDTLKY